MRITCVIHSLCGGGAERVMAALASALAERHSVHLITLDAVRGEDYPVEPEVRRLGLDVMGTSRGPVRAIINNAWRMWTLRRAIRRTRPDVVLSFCDTTNILTLAAMVGDPTPIVVSERTDPRFQKLGRMWSWLRRRVYRRCAVAIAQTHGAADQVSRWTGRPVIVIPSSLVPRPHHQAADSAEPIGASTSPAILCLGRLAPEKGFDLAIAAMAQVAARFPNWTMRIAGDGPERGRLLEQIDRMGLRERVSLVGWVEDVDRFLGSGEVFLLSSRYEGFPQGLLEAMAQGLACVAVDCPSGPAEILSDGTDGILVEPGDAGALSAALESVMEDAALRRRLGAAARESVQRFAWEAMVERYLDVLEEHASD